jgi:signal recognition particle subunit SRP54
MPQLHLLRLHFPHHRGPISKLASMIPGLPTEMLQGGDEEGSRRMKRMLFMTDSMTAAELDSDGMIFLEKEVGRTYVRWRRC